MFYNYYMTHENYPSEASIMAARQMKVVSKSDAFKITVCL